MLCVILPSGPCIVTDSLPPQRPQQAFAVEHTNYTKAIAYRDGELAEMLSPPPPPPPRAPPSLYLSLLYLFANIRTPHCKSRLPHFSGDMSYVKNPSQNRFRIELAEETSIAMSARINVNHAAASVRLQGYYLSARRKVRQARLACRILVRIHPRWICFTYLGAAIIYVCDLRCLC